MKISNIVRHIRHFEKTGKISNSLVQFFDQRGRWCQELLPFLPNESATRRYEIPHSMMRNIILPEERRITGAKSRPVLRTSFVAQNEPNLNIPYSEIRGSVLVKKNAMIHAESLRRVGGDFSTDTTVSVCVPKLQTVVGNFDACRSSILNAPSLRGVGGNLFLLGRIPPNLVAIGGRCIIQKAISTRENALRSVGESLILNDLDNACFPKLEFVGEHMVMLVANRVEARMLREVGGTLLAGQAEIIVLPKLRFVGGVLNSLSAKEFYHPELVVGGSWMQAPGAEELWIRRMQALAILKGNQGSLYL
jgi:hypothetical protein